MASELPLVFCSLMTQLDEPSSAILSSSVSFYVSRSRHMWQPLCATNWRQPTKEFPPDLSFRSSLHPCLIIYTLTYSLALFPGLGLGLWSEENQECEEEALFAKVCMKAKKRNLVTIGYHLEVLAQVSVIGFLNICNTGNPKHWPLHGSKAVYMKLNGATQLALSSLKGQHEEGGLKTNTYKKSPLIGADRCQSCVREAGSETRGLTWSLIQSLLRTDRTVRFPRTDNESESALWIERERVDGKKRGQLKRKREKCFHQLGEKRRKCVSVCEQGEIEGVCVCAPSPLSTLYTTTSSMSLPGSPPLLSPGSGAPTSAALYRTAPDGLHTSVASTGTSSPAHTNSHSHSHSLSPSPRLTSSMLSAFLPGLGNGGSAPLVSGGGGGASLGPLGGLGSLSTAGLTPGSPGMAQTSSSPGLCSECKLVEVHGVKVASFSVDGQELICLPQVFDLFLKHLVGGLHTVYTKLKRLDITPVVCTVEQVRVLRGLGAIQPGVNRCKLISRKDFETLYQDCTSARSVIKTTFQSDFFCKPMNSNSSDGVQECVGLSETHSKSDCDALRENLE
ncbi:Dachshund -like protein 2 [Collichthys lucidus]|uniref:Dachshund-like protein 2 n=1 Tax=Collichthys lucidus TaxID=240159 RepID=A0A4U5VXF7_COLLU|nr:Dachshund -like protein 2 [Collichthys lucidus]